ncbi:MAG: pyruvate formate lyase family protein [Planctomycetota bacterium]|jgi:formate C-acetyltransferase
MKEYYCRIRHCAAEADSVPSDVAEARSRIVVEMDAYAAANPELPACTLKAHLHELIAETAPTVIFTDSPFFFELGMRRAENWGCPDHPSHAPGSWLFFRNRHLMNTEGQRLADAFRQGKEGPYLWNLHGGFDWDHHCLGYSRLLDEGVNGLIEQIVSRLDEVLEPSQRPELEAMLTSCRAVLRVAERFSIAAEERLAVEEDPLVRMNLQRIVEAARHIPANPPRTFYEGLAFLLFIREVSASLESIGISVLGHVDRLLIDLYRSDLAEGRLTEDNARSLIADWMRPHDIKTFARERDWPETSTCITLGGCDWEGSPIFNELTRLFIEVHRDEGFLNPKLNCRYDGDAAQAYLELVGETVLGGHNHFALLNDDVLVESAVRMGKSRPQARRYVNGGCQEPMCEGIEHTAGAFYYFNMAQFLHLAFTGCKDEYGHLQPEQYGPLPKRLEGDDFEAFYTNFMEGLKVLIRQGADWSRDAGHEAVNVNPCPFFSATLEGCIEQGKDYTAGGALFNPSGVSLVGLGDVVNSLVAVKTAVYDRGWVGLAELQDQVRKGWPDESLRQRMIACPRFGQGQADADNLAHRFAEETAAFIKSIPNERGEVFQPSFFVYIMFKRMGDLTGATPDGRREGDILCQGIAPNQMRAPKSLNQAFESLKAIDYAEYPGNAVLDVQLPAGGTLSKGNVAALIRTFARMGGPTLQLNCVDPEVLKEAQHHPEEYGDLSVRISGLSAIFVSLQPDVQEEIIERAMMG